jgi:hypothetical protein
MFPARGRRRTRQREGFQLRLNAKSAMAVCGFVIRGTWRACSGATDRLGRGAAWQMSMFGVSVRGLVSAIAPPLSRRCPRCPKADIPGALAEDVAVRAPQLRTSHE